MRNEIWTNADGLQVGFGTRDTVNLEAGSIHTKGRVHQVELEVYFDQDPATSNVKSAVIPAGAHVLSAQVVVSEAFVGGTSLSAGTIKTDGTGAAATALVTATEGATANLTLNAVVTGAGALVGEVTANDINLTYATTGAFTAGRGTLLVEYVLPSAK